MEWKSIFLWLISSLWFTNCTAPNPISNPINIDTEITVKNTLLSIDTLISIDLNRLLMSTKLTTIDLSDYNLGKAAFLLPLSFIGNHSTTTPPLLKFQNFASGRGSVLVNGKSSLREPIPVVNELDTELQFPSYIESRPKETYLEIIVTTYQAGKLLETSKKILFVFR
jgi:hypothetical protein